MKKITFYILSSLLILINSANLKAQTYTVSTQIPWHTEHQNMWGPNGDPFDINMTLDLFHVYYDTSMSIGYIEDVLGGQFGANFNINTWMLLGSTFEMTGFTTGWIDVNYPVQVNLTFPNNYTWNPGEWVTIQSDYDLLDGWFLHSQFPQAGVISLDLDYGFGLDINADVCLYDCTNLQLIDIDVPADSLILFYLNGQTGEVIYPCADNGSFGFCHDTVLPITFNNFANTGLSGEITIPYIETHDHLDLSDECHQTILADGDSTYAYFDLDILQFLSFIAGFLPPPQGPAIQQFVDALNGTYDLGGGITIDYSLLTANLLFSSTMQQDLSFHPTVWSTLSFPTPLEYYVTDPSNNTVDSGVSDTIKFAACQDLHIHWPCFGWPSMDVGINHSIDPTFTNHTWDSIAFTFAITALEFTINIPIPVTPPAEMPGFCIPLDHDQAPILKSDSISTVIVTDTCSKGSSANTTEAVNTSLDGESTNTDSSPPDLFVCSRPYFIPGVDTPDIELIGLKWSYHIGPLVDEQYPLGYIPFTWYNNTWELEGFQDTTIDPVTMIPNPEIAIVDTADQDVQCAGDSTGYLVVQIENGTPPYTYSWSNGVVHTSPNHTDTLYNVGAGTYEVTVSDANGCELTAQYDIVELDPPIIVDYDVTDVLCYGDSTGAIDITVSGGTPGYTYYWDPTASTNEDLTNLPAGTYTVFVTDAVGCTKEVPIDVLQPDTPLILTIDTFENVLCNGGNNAFIDLNVIGGTPPYTYQWNNGETTEDLQFLTAGTYTVTVTDANGCSETISQTITEPDPIAVEDTIHNVSCYGGSDGYIDITVTGGTPPYSYSWSIGDSTQDINNLIEGNYSVTVTDDHGCQYFATYYVDEPDAPLQSSITAHDVLCHGESTGSADLTVTGGVLPYSYQWSNGATTEDINNVPAGEYTVTITDLYGCVLIDSVYIDEPDEPLQLTATVEDVRCHGEYNGSITLNITGGTPSYTIIWNTGAQNTVYEGLAAGTYSVTVNDANGCKIYGEYEVNEPQPLYAAVTEPQQICIGETAQIWVAATGGTYPYSFEWSNGMTVDTIYVEPDTTTDYSVTVTDSHGCQFTPEHTTVNVYPPLSATVTLSDDTVCPGDNVEIDIQVQGGNGEYHIYLDTNEIQVPYTYYSGTLTGNRYLHFTITDGCTTPHLTIDTSFYVINVPTLSFSPDTTAGCPPLNVTFNLNVFYPGLVYRWDFGDVTNFPETEHQNITHIYTQPGTYTVTVYTTTEEGCQVKQTAENLITIYPVPDAEFITDPTVIQIFHTQINFYNLSQGATDYIWDFGDGDSSLQENPAHIFNFLHDHYTVTLTARNFYGCVDTAVKVLQVADFYTFWAPNAFTPDNDGVNDIFITKGTNVDNSTFSLYIYDRWGELIFQSNDINKGWDGTVNGKKAEVGTYKWHAEFYDRAGKFHTYSGNVILIR